MNISMDVQTKRMEDMREKGAKQENKNYWEVKNRRDENVF